MNAIKTLEESYRKEVPPFNIGDTVSVSQIIKEGEKQRVQVFTGTVIGRQGSGVREIVTVRKISNGVGVEKLFPLHSPLLEGIKVVKHGVVRRAKLYYLRDKKGKAAKVKERAYYRKK